MINFFLLFLQKQFTVDCFKGNRGFSLMRNLISLPSICALLGVICRSTCDLAPYDWAAAVIFDVNTHKRRFFWTISHQEGIGSLRKLMAHLLLLLDFCCARYNFIDLGKEARVFSYTLLMALRGNMFVVFCELFLTNGADKVSISRSRFTNENWTFFNFGQLSLLFFNSFSVAVA